MLCLSGRALLLLLPVGAVRGRAKSNFVQTDI